MCYCTMMTLLLMRAAAGLTLAGTGSACTMPSMMRLQTSDARRTPSFSAASAVDCHQPYIARKQRRNRTTFTLIQVDVLLRFVIDDTADCRSLFAVLSAFMSGSLVFANSNDFSVWPPMRMHGRPLYFAQVLYFFECRLQRSLFTAWNLTKLCHVLAERASFKNRCPKFGVHPFKIHGAQN